MDKGQSSDNLKAGAMGSLRPKHSRVEAPKHWVLILTGGTDGVEGPGYPAQFPVFLEVFL